MKIEINKKYTSNGSPIRILCTDRPRTAYPVIGMNDYGTLEHFKENGASASDKAYSLVEVWEPQVGEWCWFWDNTSKDNTYLNKYSEMEGELFVSTNKCAWDNCAKFTGELPEHLKDK
jgi:hypothetical protein